MGSYGPLLIDVAVFLVLAWYVYDGWRRGCSTLLIETASLVGALVLALALSPMLSRVLVQYTNLGALLAKSLAFIGICVVVKYGFAFVEPWVHFRVPEKFRASHLNHYFGIVPGAFYGAFVLFVMLTFVLATPLPPKLKVDMLSSRAGLALRVTTEALDRTLTPRFGSFFKEMLPLQTTTSQVTEESLASIALPFKTTKFIPSAEDERKMFALTNTERVSNGLPALKWDEQLVTIGRAHDADMLTRGYFSHMTPEGKSPVDRADAARYVYRLFGENIALAPSVVEAHQALMKSPGHRANILSKEFTKIGIGIQNAGSYGLMVTESFAD